MFTRTEKGEQERTKKSEPSFVRGEEEEEEDDHIEEWTNKSKKIYERNEQAKEDRRKHKIEAQIHQNEKKAAGENKRANQQKA